jgi:hypothetical protein
MKNISNKELQHRIETMGVTEIFWIQENGHRRYTFK